MTGVTPTGHPADEVAPQMIDVETGKIAVTETEIVSVGITIRIVLAVTETETGTGIASMIEIGIGIGIGIATAAADETTWVTALLPARSVHPSALERTIWMSTDPNISPKAPDLITETRRPQMDLTASASLTE
jgi:hypothetical protein